jgi:hypothetical protein
MMRTMPAQAPIFEASPWMAWATKFAWRRVPVAGGGTVWLERYRVRTFHGSFGVSYVARRRISKRKI